MPSIASRIDRTRGSMYRYLSQRKQRRPRMDGRRMKMIDLRIEGKSDIEIAEKYNMSTETVIEIINGEMIG